MTARSFIVLAALLLEDGDLWRAFMPGDAGGNGSSADKWPAHFRLFVAGQQQNIQLNRLADFLVDRGHAHRSAFFHAKLFAASPDYCVRHSHSSLRQVFRITEKSFIIGIDYPGVNAPAAVVCDCFFMPLLARKYSINPV